MCFAVSHRQFAQDVEASDLSVSSVRRALASEHARIAAYPSEAKNYIDLAYTLVDAGLGDEGKNAAAQAVRVAPKSAFAFSAQGWVLHHNSIGVDYGKGFDYDGSLAALRKSIQLDPENLDTRESLANVLEYDREGVRYGPNAQLSAAIENYRYVKQHQRVPKDDVEDNLGIDLFYAGRYEEAITEIGQLSGSTKRQGILLSSLAATKGSPATIALSARISGDEQVRKDALVFAAEGLWNMRLYPQAADLLIASLPNASEGNSISTKIQLFKGLKPYRPEDLPASDPRKPVQQFVVAAFTNSLNESVMSGILSRHSYATDKDWQAALRLRDVFSSGLTLMMRQTGLPRVVLADLVLNRLKVSVIATPGRGSSVVAQGVAAAPHHFFVLPENGSFRIVAAGENSREVGAQALYLLDNKEIENAASLLNWKLARVDRSKEEDPLGGLLFARLWTTKTPAEPSAILLAAASLVDHPSVLLSLLPKIVSLRASASTEADRTNLDLLLTSIYLRLKDAPHAHITATLLLVHYPDSSTAIGLVGRADGLDRNWSAWKGLLAPRLLKQPGNRDLLLERASEAIAEGDYGGARAAYRVILDGEHPTSEDNNVYAWLSLFEGDVDDQALAAAQQASLTAGNRNYAQLHTLACLNAARGNTAEAHQELLDAMTGASLEEANGDIWYGFGRIYEQYGVNDAAVAAYRRVVQAEAASGAELAHDGASTYVLALARLKALHSD